MGAEADRVIKLWERRQGARVTYLAHCQEVADHTYPDRNDYLVEKTPGMKRMSKIFDNTAVFAQEMFAGGMHSLLSSPWMQFANLWSENDRLNADDAVRFWLQDASEVMWRLFSSTAHGFATASHELYLDEASIGQACMSTLTSQRTGKPRFRTHHMKGVTLAENEDGQFDDCIRSWKWTAAQAVDEWDVETLKRAGCEKLLKAYAEGAETRFTFLHRVAPRRGQDRRHFGPRALAFESVYVVLDEKSEIEIGGFKDFVFVCPRLTRLPDETYGRGLGMLNLPDIKMLYQMVQVVLKGAQKVIDPPLQVPDSGFLVPIKTVPGALNVYRATSQGRIEPLDTNGNIPVGVELINALKQQILRGYYVEWMVMPSDPGDPAAAGKGVTATYVLQQRDEKMRLLAPLLARLQAEFLGPLIDRVFGMLWRQSMAAQFNDDPARGPISPFKQPPPALARVPLRVEYVSPLALAQKSSQMDAVTRLLQLQTQLRQIDPQSQVVIDGPFMMQLAAKDWNAAAGVLKSPDRLKDEAQQQADALQAKSQIDGAGALADAAKAGTHAVKNLAQALPAGSGGAPMARAA